MTSIPVRRLARPLSIDWGHLLTVMAMAAWVLWYLADVRAASLDLENTLLVQPLCIALLVMLLAVLPQCVRKEELPDGLKPDPLDRTSFLKVLGLMVSFGVFVWAMFNVGFDLAVFAFSLVALAICGERRWWFMLIFAALSAVILVKGYQLLVPFQMPNVLLR